MISLPLVLGLYYLNQYFNLDCKFEFLYLGIGGARRRVRVYLVNQQLYSFKFAQNNLGAKMQTAHPPVALAAKPSRPSCQSGPIPTELGIN